MVIRPVVVVTQHDEGGLVQHIIVVEIVLRSHLSGQLDKLIIRDDPAVAANDDGAAGDMCEHGLVLEQIPGLVGKAGDHRHGEEGEGHEDAEEDRQLGHSLEAHVTQVQAAAQSVLELAGGRRRGGGGGGGHPFGGTDGMVGLHGTVKDADVAGGVVLHLLKVVGDDDDQLILGDLSQKLNDLGGGLAVQVTRGLVAEEDGGILGQSAGDDGPLLLTARELASLVVDVAFQPHATEQLHGPLTARLGILDIHEGQLHVLQDGEALDDVVLLEDEGYVLLAVLLPVLLQVVGGRLPLHQQLTLLVGVHTADDV